MNEPRYVVTVDKRGMFSFARVIDTKTGRCMGATDSYRDKGPAGYKGSWFIELCEIQAHALNNPWKEKA